MRNNSVLLLTVLAAVLVPLNAAPITFYGNLSGPNEEPPNASPATGFTLVTIDRVAHTLEVFASFSGLLGLSTAAHIHVINGPADANLADTIGPVATQTPSFAGFPLGVTSGSFFNIYDTTLASTYRAGFITAAGSVALAEDALFDAIEEGRAYFNIHSTAVPGGEIRDFLQPVPEPATSGLVALSIAGLVLARRRKAA